MRKILTVACAALIAGMPHKVVADGLALGTADLEARVAALEALVIQLQSQISANSGLISANSSQISTNSGQISANSGQISANSGQISTNSGLISANSGQISTNYGLISANSSQISTNSGQISANSYVLQYVSIENGELNGVTGPHFIIEGANVHVRSGAGSTSEGCSGQDFGCANRTGLGNLIIGYNEQRQVWIDNAFPNYVPNQTSGAYSNTGELCDADPEFRDDEGFPLCDRREGSHGLIVGRWNNNMGHANFVAGLLNDVGGHFVSVIGGQQNSATANYSVVSGGLANRAHGFASSVSGGSHNITGQAVGLPFGRTASVSGGTFNVAEAENSSVTGGAGNLAAELNSSISGGEYNRTLQGGFSSAISGGSYNTASGERSSITGGQSRSADTDDCVLGDNLAGC